MPVANRLCYGDAFVLLYCLRIHLEEKCRGMLMQMVRKEVEYQAHTHTLPEVLLKLC